jgi:hypothetical protein
MDPLNGLRSLLERTRSGGAGEADRQSLQRALLSGQLSVGTGHREVTVTGDVVESVIVAGDGNVLLQGADAEAVESALADLIQRIENDRSERALRDYFRALRAVATQTPNLVMEEQLAGRRVRSLDEIYTVPRFVDAKQEQSEEAKEPPALSIAEVIRAPADDPSRPLLIVGDPGTGKSTLLRHVARHAWDDPEAVGLACPSIPMIVPLRCIARATGVSVEARLRRALEEAGEFLMEEDLPPGFLRDWTRRLDARWLFLLDGLDEVSTAERPDLLRWIRTMRDMAAPMGRLVLTSRPVAAAIVDDSFGVYRLQRFTPAQTEDFARTWLGGRATNFLERLRQMRTGALAATPLLVTIAARVYEIDGNLPGRRAGLYERFVTICLEEARRRGLGEELGERLAKIVRLGLTALARSLFEEDAVNVLSSLDRKAADYLAHALQLPPAEAIADGKRFVEVLGRRSGILIRRGSESQWLHPTFGEYLAATALTDDYDAETDEARDLVAHWSDDRWREVVLFALGIWSAAEQDVTTLVRGIWRTDAEGRTFAATALAEGVRVAPPLRDAIELMLFGRARRGGLVDLIATNPHLLPLAQSLPDRKWDTTELVAQARARGGEDDLCWYVPGALAVIGRTDELLSLGRDREVAAKLRLQVCRELAQLGRNDDAAEVLVGIGRDRAHEVQFRWQAARVLGEMGRSDLAGPILLGLLRSREGIVGQAHGFARDLGRFKCTRELRAVAQDPRMLSKVRAIAATALCEQGNVESAVQFVRDDRLDVEDRIDTAVALGSLGRDEDAMAALREFIHDPAVEEAADRRKRDEARALYPGFVESTEKMAAVLGKESSLFRSGVREKSVEAIRRLGHADELRSLLRNEDWRVQLAAAKALGELGQGADAFDLVMERVEEAEKRTTGQTYDAEASEILKRAVEALGALRNQAAAPKLLAILRAADGISAEGEEAAKALKGLDRREELLDVVRDEALEIMVRTWAGEMLGELGVAEGPRIIASEPGAFEWKRVDAAKALARLGHTAEATEVLEQLANDASLDDADRDTARLAMLEIRPAEAAPTLVELVHRGTADLGARESAINSLAAHERNDDLVALARDATVARQLRARAARLLSSPVALRPLVDDAELDGLVRAAAAIALGEAGDADGATAALVGIVRNPELDRETRQQSARALAELKRVDELQAVIHDPELDATIRASAALGLADIGQRDPLWSLARESDVDEAVGMAAAQGLHLLGRDDDLLALTEDTRLRPIVRITAAAGLTEGLAAESASSFLRSVCRDARSLPRDRQEAAGVLAKLGEVAVVEPVLEELMRDRSIDPAVQQRAGATLGDLGRHVDEVAACQVSLAQDTGIDLAVRTAALKTLEQLDRDDEVASGLFSIARDPSVATHLRKMTAQMLAQHDRRDDLVMLVRDGTGGEVANLAIRLLEGLKAGEELTTLARDQAMDDDDRICAAGGAVRLGRADEVVPMLLELGLDDARNGLVRYSAAVFLHQSGRTEDGVGILVAVARGGNETAAIAEQAIATLTQLKRIEELAALGEDATLDGWVRAHAASGLSELDRGDDALTIFLKLLCDPQAESGLRSTIADALGGSGSPDVLRSLEERSKALDGEALELANAAIGRLRRHLKE